MDVTLHRPSSAAPAPAVLRAGAILHLLAAADGEPVPIARLAAAIGAPRSSTMNICAALAELKFVAATRGGFTLGRGLAELAHAYLDTFAPVQRFHEACREVGPALEATAQLATLDGSEVVYLARHDGPQLIRIASRVGGRLPANCTGLGKAMLGSLAPADLDTVLGLFPSPLPTLTEHSIGDLAALRAQIDRVRQDGYALDAEETTPGIVCVAVPLSPRQEIDAAYAISASILRVNASEDTIAGIVDTLRDIAAHTGAR